MTPSCAKNVTLQFGTPTNKHVVYDAIHNYDNSARTEKVQYDFTKSASKFLQSLNNTDLTSQGG